MLNIEIKTIPDDTQRYNTVGDYWKKDGKDYLRISDMGSWKYEMLVAIHELVEEMLCRARHISDSSITNFDERYEKHRKYGVLDEPGDDKHAPYHKEHAFATKIEKLCSDELGVNWEEYMQLTTRLDDSTKAE
jgi:hypothetical protein